MNKPTLWKYKSGLKIGKLRPLAKKYLSEKLKIFYQTKKRQLELEEYLVQLTSENSFLLNKINSQLKYLINYYMFKK